MSQPKGDSTQLILNRLGGCTQSNTALNTMATDVQAPEASQAENTHMPSILAACLPGKDKKNHTPGSS